MALEVKPDRRIEELHKQARMGPKGLNVCGSEKVFRIRGKQLIKTKLLPARIHERNPFLNGFPSRISGPRYGANPVLGKMRVFRLGFSRQDVQDLAPGIGAPDPVLRKGDDVVLRIQNQISSREPLPSRHRRLASCGSWKRGKGASRLLQSEGHRKGSKRVHRACWV
jgi:hypothetical protein